MINNNLRLKTQMHHLKWGVTIARLPYSTGVISRLSNPTMAGGWGLPVDRRGGTGIMIGSLRLPVTQ